MVRGKSGRFKLKTYPFKEMIHFYLVFFVNYNIFIVIFFLEELPYFIFVNSLSVSISILLGYTGCNDGGTINEKDDCLT